MQLTNEENNAEELIVFSSLQETQLPSQDVTEIDEIDVSTLDDYSLFLDEPFNSVVKIENKENTNFKVRWKAAVTISQNMHEYYLMKLIFDYFNITSSVLEDMKSLSSPKEELQINIFPKELNNRLEDIESYIAERISSKKSTVMSLSFLSKKSINKLIIPFLNTYPLISKKRLDFYDFLELFKMIENNKHRTKEGFDIMKEKIKGMNRGRTD